VLCLIFIGCILAGISITIAAVICAVGMVCACLAWNRTTLSWALLPWQLLIFVTGLFLVMDTLTAHGLGSVMGRLIGTDPGTAGIARAAGTGAIASNLLNNLPVYVAGEAVIPAANHDQLLALLLGTNVGALVTPWAALATLLWAGRCRAAGLDIPWLRFITTSAGVGLVALAAGAGTLTLAR